MAEHHTAPTDYPSRIEDDEQELARLIKIMKILKCILGLAVTLLIITLVAPTQISDTNGPNFADPATEESGGIQDNPIYDDSDVPPNIKRMLEKAGLRQQPFPSAVFLWIDSYPQGWFCTGVLIAEDIVLTAAHCVEGDVYPEEIWLVFGGHNMLEVKIREFYECLP